MPPTTTARACVLFAVLITAIGLSACTTRAFMADAPTRADMGIGSQSCEAVFDTPEATWVLAGYERSELPEYSRRDGGMSIATTAALTATSQWPVPERPSPWAYRTVYLPAHRHSGYLEFTYASPVEAYRPMRRPVRYR